MQNGLVVFVQNGKKAIGFQIESKTEKTQLFNTGCSEILQISLFPLMSKKIGAELTEQS
jgi:hypothetical protein